MGDGDKVCCVLCQRSEETEITGPLSTNDEVTAHQNCLLFSSGLYCRNSPQFDDLFGFSVEDVLSEVKRGSKLICSLCKLKGATAGCEVRRCKKSYHYPCAVKDHAEIVEDADRGEYGLYCLNHCPQTQENNGSINGSPSSSTKSRTSKSSSEAGSSKKYCLACKKVEGNISLESSYSSVVMLYCDKHAPASHRRNTSGGSTAAGQPSVYSSDSNSSSSAARSSSKRRLNSTNNHRQEETPSKRKSKGCKRIVSDDSNSGLISGDDSEMMLGDLKDDDQSDDYKSIDNVLDSEMAIFAPLEMDLDESANSVPEPQLIRKDTESPIGSTSGNHLEEENKYDNKEEDETFIHSDAESESLLLPVSRPCLVTASTQTASTLLPAVLLKTEAQKEDEEPSTYSTSFWKNCNVAGCTQAIFTGFINEMNDISSRIQADQASQEDCDIALTVMMASRKLAELVAKQKDELERKQKELQKAAAAMEEAASALRR